MKDKIKVKMWRILLTTANQLIIYLIILMKYKCVGTVREQ